MLISNSLNIKHSYNQYFSTSFGKSNEVADSLSGKQKAAILGASTAGMVSGLALSGRRQGINIFRWHQFKKINIGASEILSLAGGSILGGLIAGIAVDKGNKRDKLRESLQQMVGNIIFPVSFVAGGNYLYDKIEPAIRFPKLQNKVVNAVVRSLPPVIVTFLGLGTGIVIGNKFANSINNKIFKKEEKRQIKVTDFAAHVDDTLLGASLVAQNLSSSSSLGGGTSVIGATAAKLIPPALIIPGYMTGTAQN